MIDIICTQRIKPGMEERAEKLMREAEKQTLANDKGCERYEWYRAKEPDTYVLIERWTDMECAQMHLRSPHMTNILKELADVAPEKFTINRLTRLS
jgi:quinol monooxygenase YgiN